VTSSAVAGRSMMPGIGGSGALDAIPGHDGHLARRLRGGWCSLITDPAISQTAMQELADELAEQVPLGVP
jgi:hypothetical protein